MTQPAEDIAPHLESDFYTINELRKLLNLGRNQVYDIVTKEMRHLRFGTQYRVPKSEYQAWLTRRLNQQQVTPTTIPFTLNAPIGRGQRQKR